MNQNLNPKKASAIEDALKLKDEGKRLSYIIEKLPNYESEIREIFGIVAFIRENNDKVPAPKNILKTLLSKVNDNSINKKEVDFRKKIEPEHNVYFPPEKEIEDGEVYDETSDLKNNLPFGKWKIIVSVGILSIVMATILLRSGPVKNVEVINENMEASLNSFDLSSTSESSEIASSTETSDN